MPCSLPPEILDLIIDLLHDDPAALKTCCVVSKSWIQRTRKYLFIDIKLHPPGHSVRRWRETFPDLTNSPAHHTRTLSICNPKLIATTDMGMIHTFCGVEHLTVDTDLWQDQWVSLVPLRGLSPVLRSLHLTFTSLPDSEIFGLICSLPLLEDLALVSRGRQGGGWGGSEGVEWNIPSTSPRLTGSLELRMVEGIRSITHRLLNLPNGLRFTKIAVAWVSKEDALPTLHLMSRCSDTLVSLEIADNIRGLSETPSFDLSKAINLQDIAFRCRNSNIQWITTALHSTELKNIRQISLHLHDLTSRGPEWLDFDSLLVQYLTSHSVRIKVTCELVIGREDSGNRVARLLPELTRRGAVKLIERPYVHQAFPGFAMTLV